MAIRELLLIGLVFNVYWLMAVIGQSHFILGLLIILLVAWWFYKGALRFAVLLGGAGITMDFLLTRFGLLYFDNAIFPAWLALLWLGFGSFVWIMRRTIMAYSPYVMALIGGLGGMMSYLAGFRLGAVSWPLGPGMTALILLLCWLCFSVLILKLLDRYSKQEMEEV